LSITNSDFTGAARTAATTNSLKRPRCGVTAVRFSVRAPNRGFFSENNLAVCGTGGVAMAFVPQRGSRTNAARPSFTNHRPHSSGASASVAASRGAVVIGELLTKAPDAAVEGIMLAHILDDCPWERARRAETKAGVDRIQLSKAHAIAMTKATPPKARPAFPKFESYHAALSSL
jgi:hypothetical protein